MAEDVTLSADEESELPLAMQVAPGEKAPIRQSAGEWMPMFLATLRKTANVRMACDAAGIHRSAAYTWKRRSKAFAAKWQEMIDDAVDVVEAKARSLALDGDTRMISLILKAHRRDVYGDHVNVDSAQGVKIHVEYEDNPPPEHS